MDVEKLISSLVDKFIGRIGFEAYSEIVHHSCGCKSLNRFAILFMDMPERHDAFARAGRPGKKSLLSVCVCG